MASIQPFRGTRYNPDVVGELSAVVAPPYDVISEKKREELIALSPYNVVRLILPEARKGMDQFQTSAALIKEWLKEKILMHEDEPCVYLYRHEFEIEGRSLARTGLIATLDLEAGGVSGHEKTVSAPKEGRTKLLAATRSSLGPIFMLYPDPDLSVRRLLEEAETEQIADMRVDGDRHVLTVIKDSAVHAQMSDLLAPKKFMIADGHHRYGAALSNYQSAKEAGSAEEWNRFTMAFCVAMEDPGLAILAAHRLLAGLTAPIESCLASLEELADVKSVNGLEEALAGMTEGGKGTFGLCAGSPPSFYTVSIVCRSASENTLDVEILHEILESVFKSDKDTLNLMYTHSAHDGAKQVANGTASMCFFLQPVRTEELLQFGEIARLMPPKTTYFHPKPLTGLIMKSPTC